MPFFRPGVALAVLAAAGPMVSLPSAQAAPGPQVLQVVAEFPRFQPTGVAVSKDGRVFLNFPHWDEFHALSVAELLPDGKRKPYPLEWDQDGPASATAGSPSSNAFYCVQSVVCDDQDTLWIVDSGSPGMKGVVGGQAKLVAVDLATNKARKVIVFNNTAAPTQSYLNDVRVDTGRKVAYLTDSGLGALLVVDLEKGDVRRLLESRPELHADPGFALTVLGKALLGPDGKPPQIHSDGIELSPDRNTLYFHALCGKALYKIDTDSLRDPTLSDAQLGAKIVKVADTGPLDGLGADGAGRIYLSCLEDGAIRRVDPNAPGAPVETVAQDPRFFWPDSFAVTADGTVWFTCSQIENMPRFNGGRSTRTTPYQLFKMVP